MSLEENKAIVRRMVEAVNKRNVDLIHELVAPDFAWGFTIVAGYFVGIVMQLASFLLFLCVRIVSAHYTVG